MKEKKKGNAHKAQGRHGWRSERQTLLVSLLNVKVVPGGCTEDPVGLTQSSVSCANVVK